MTPQELSQMIWGIKELIRDDYDDKNVDEVILPFTLLRRLDCVIEGTSQIVQETMASLPEDMISAHLPNILKTKKISFYNISGFSLGSMLTNAAALGDNFETYLNGFSDNIKEILYNFSGGKEKGLSPIYETLLRKNLLYKVTHAFVTRADLHPAVVDNHTMGTVFEMIIRYSKESTNTTAGQYYTPREIVKLLVDLVFCGQENLLKQPGKHFSIYDPCCGTGGILTVAKEQMLNISGRKKEMQVYLYGQEINEKTYAICKSDVLMKGEDSENIKLGNTISNDHLKGKKFTYMITNPPFGVDWNKDKDFVESEAQNPNGRFTAGLPDTSDGSLLFLMHMIDKMETSGSRIGIVLNSSPLFSGDAGSGWSNIRKMLIDQDLLDMVVSLPKNLFYGTDITTYMWILDNKKPQSHKNKVLLINGAQPEYASLLAHNLGKKRFEVSEFGNNQLVNFYRDYQDTWTVLSGQKLQITKLMDADDFFYTKVTVDRPLRLKFEKMAARTIEFIEANQKATLNDKAKIQALCQLLNDENPLTMDDREFFAYLKKKEIKLTAGLIKKIRAHFGETDETYPEVHENPYQRDSPFLPDTDLRDTESIPKKTDIEIYFKEEVLKFAPDAWMDRDKDKIGCEYPFTKLFYVYKPFRPAKDIWEEIMTLEEKMEDVLGNIKNA